MLPACTFPQQDRSITFYVGSIYRTQPDINGIKPNETAKKEGRKVFCLRLKPHVSLSLSLSTGQGRAEYPHTSHLSESLQRTLATKHNSQPSQAKSRRFLRRRKKKHTVWQEKHGHPKIVKGKHAKTLQDETKTNQQVWSTSTRGRNHRSFIPRTKNKIKPQQYAVTPIYGIKNTLAAILSFPWTGRTTTPAPTIPTSPRTLRGPPRPPTGIDDSSNSFKQLASIHPCSSSSS